MAQLRIAAAKIEHPPNFHPKGDTLGIEISRPRKGYLQINPDKPGNEGKALHEAAQVSLLTARTTSTGTLKGGQFWGLTHFWCIFLIRQRCVHRS